MEYTPNARHLLNDILFIACCAVISGADSWEDIEEYGYSKEQWLRTLLELPHGLPSNDTYRRVFSAISPDAFEASFQNWIQGMISNVAGDVIPIDGKRLRGAFRAGGNVIHQVSAWSCQHQLVLGQVTTADKSNEITAIPALLELLDIEGATITIDALGTQKKIAKQIIDQKGDYILALKGNQETLHNEVEAYFESSESCPDDPKVTVLDSFESVEKGHGRIEQRRCWVSQDLESLTTQGDWKGLKSIVKVESSRTLLAQNKETFETRYYISSLEDSAEDIAQKIRQHWEVENKLHWVLDVSFNEDASTIYTDNAAENLSRLRKIGLILLKQDTSQGSLKGKRKRAGWNDEFLLSLFREYVK